jgi:3-isopropylmalate/(R)-2-methylmalate dehydratase large subunit
MTQPSTLFEKIWRRHVVCEETADTPAVLYIDLQLLHEVTSPQAFDELKRRGLGVRRPDRCLATIDHSTPTTPPEPDGSRRYVTDQAKAQVDRLHANCAEHDIVLHGWDSPHRGIVHVMGPELGATQPGMTIVCGDSHTATHGAFGALAFGIGTTEVGHVLATQCLLQTKPKTLGIRIEGDLGQGVTAKDVIRLGDRILRFHRPWDGHGKPDDDVQHVDRVRRARRHGGARPGHLRLPARQADGPTGG